MWPRVARASTYLALHAHPLPVLFVIHQRAADSDVQVVRQHRRDGRHKLGRHVIEVGLQLCHKTSGARTPRYPLAWPWRSTPSKRCVPWKCFATTRKHMSVSGSGVLSVFRSSSCWAHTSRHTRKNVASMVRPGTPGASSQPTGAPVEQPSCQQLAAGTWTQPRQWQTAGWVKRPPSRRCHAGSPGGVKPGVVGPRGVGHQTLWYEWRAQHSEGKRATPKQRRRRDVDFRSHQPVKPATAAVHVFVMIECQV